MLIFQFRAEFGDPQSELHDRRNFTVRVDLDCPIGTELDKFGVQKWYEQCCNAIDEVADSRLTGNRAERDMRVLAKRRLLDRLVKWQTFTQNQLYQLYRTTGMN